MKRATGIGGIFFRCDDPKKMSKWYQKHLGINMFGGNGYFQWRENDKPRNVALSILGFFAKKTKYFGPGKKQFMLNFRVDNLEALLKQLKKEGLKVQNDIEVYDYGKFAWITDPEGNKIELWEPKDKVFQKMLDN
jgi:predicted enzyme related to lactoylglutathione lyase